MIQRSVTSMRAMLRKKSSNPSRSSVVSLDESCLTSVGVVDDTATFAQPREHVIQVDMQRSSGHGDLRTDSAAAPVGAPASSSRTAASAPAQDASLEFPAGHFLARSSMVNRGGRVAFIDENGALPLDITGTTPLEMCQITGCELPGSLIDDFELAEARVSAAGTMTSETDDIAVYELPGALVDEIELAEPRLSDAAGSMTSWEIDESAGALVDEFEPRESRLQQVATTTALEESEESAAFEIPRSLVDALELAESHASDDAGTMPWDIDHIAVSSLPGSLVDEVELRESRVLVDDWLGCELAEELARAKTELLAPRPPTMPGRVKPKRPAPFDGRWVLVNDTPRTESWMRSIAISGTDITDGDGLRFTLGVDNKGGVHLCGGRLKRSGAALLRLGKTGGVQVYLRDQA